MMSKQPAIILACWLLFIWVDQSSASSVPATAQTKLQAKGMNEQDQEVRDQLQSHGDDGTEPRETSFYFYDGDLARIEFLARQNGFSSRSTAVRTGTIITKTLAVDARSFSPVATLMEQWAEETGADYDGWECAVISKRKN